MAAKSTRLTKGTIRVAIVDDHPSVREGLRLLLQRQGEFQVVGEAGTIAEGLKMILAECPDVAIVDINLGSENALDLVRRLVDRNSQIKILVWSMYDDELYAERALSAGAMGYINKHEATEKMFQAIHRVLDGDIYVSQEISNQMLHRSIGGRPQQKLTPIAQLSDRELEVFRLIGRGMTTAEIGQSLHLSIKTVETHRQHIKDKLQIEDATKLVRDATQWVLENG